ncbi:ABC transporter substrate-binding protein [Arthrobacter cryoconiti]|uniref:ABC transporter substrate-binding protein n=1 Tax=Arthrobacter cryoconiti TaxID=748907 RepID=A0ABV8R0N8_9MICC|nr:ABC transporter substrate-binding protein [Arthrobacter cryoconiti]MCC9067491.1 ABC transporter substrate-binding protein [Arthrobacter cryoconiti]
MRHSKKFAPLAVVSVLAMTLAACSGGGTSTSGGEAAGQNLDARGPITYVQGKDNSNVIRPLVDKWNAAHKDEQVTFKEQSDNADQQHDDLVQHFKAKTGDYDVASVDVIWTAEFAAQGWLQPLKDSTAIDTTGFLPATVATGTYKDVLYAVPQTSDGGILYYRKDLVPTPPKTWDEMMGMCSIAKAKGIDCYAGQFAQYEGLTVNVAEAINTAGGTVVDKSGKPTVDTPEAKAGLNNLVQAYKDGNIPKQAVTYQEEQGRQSFEAGKLMFLRNWPYVYNLAKTDGSSTVKDTFGIAPLPGKDGPGASSLGGHNLAINADSKYKATAKDFLTFMTNAETEKFYATQGSLAPVRSDLYQDAELVKQLPYLPVLLTSIKNAVPRPVTPFYPAVTQAIQQNSFAAINGSKTVDQAMKDMQAAMASASSQ